MNNKRVTYEDAVKRLKELEEIQRDQKSQRKYNFGNAYKAIVQRQVEINKKEINLLLSIVAQRKEANKLYERVRFLEQVIINA